MQNKANGFTLVEVLVAIVIFIIGVAALTSMLITAIRGNTLARQESYAVSLAHDTLEDLRSISPSDYELDPRLDPQTNPHEYTVNSLFEKLVGNGGGYRISYRVSDLTPATGNMFYRKIREVTVTVSWSSTAPHSVTVRSLVGPNI